MNGDLVNIVMLKIYEEQQKSSPDMSNLSSKKLGWDMKTYALVVDYLIKNGLVDGAITQEGGDEPGPFWASLDTATLTLHGINTLKALGTI